MGEFKKAAEQAEAMAGKAVAKVAETIEAQNEKDKAMQPKKNKPNKILEALRDMDDKGKKDWKKVCPLPPAEQRKTIDKGTLCPNSRQSGEAKCLNGNTPYSSIEEAWARCSMDAECRKISAY